MLKKALIVLAIALGIVALLAWVASWFRAPQAVAKSTAQQWPGGLGSLDDAEKRFPPQQANDGAAKFLALAKALPKNEPLDEYVRREASRGELAIGDPPPVADVSAIRDLLLNQQVVWARREGIGGDTETNDVRAAQLTAARALIATALTKARANDASAWEELRAVRNLARSLDGQPQVMAQTAALTMARTINAVAWKMPLPAPAWLAELQQRDLIAPLLGAFQFQSASYANDGAVFPTKWLADSVEHDRRIAEELSKLTTCDVKAPSNELGVDLASVWRRAFRYRAEREASANALRVREGKPIETRSQCSDGAWTFDGATLRFSRDIATAAPDRPLPLTLRVKP